LDIENSYEDAGRAAAYAKLEFPGTYYLAFRDLPKIVFGHVTGGRALDFGCGTGRSTRFLQSLGFETIGVDISENMIKQAREIDGEGDYRIIEDGKAGDFEDNTFDLVLSAFTFDNIATMERKVAILGALRGMLKGEGVMVNLVSAPEIYTHEWASFTTKDFPENKDARSGDKVKIIITDVEDGRPVEDIVWSDEDYREVYGRAGLELLEMFKPLARAEEPYEWISETRIAPWVVYVLKKSDGVDSGFNSST
jgi:SAM-dependent methyltransferase